MKKRVLALLSALAMLVVMFTGCSAGKQKISSADELNSSGFKIGTVQGPASMYITEEKFPKAEIKYYQNAADCYTALASDQLDAMVYSRCILENYAETDNKIALISGNVGYADICVGLKKGSNELKAKVDEFIAQAKADGTLADMEKRWIGVDNPVMPEIEKPANPVGTLRIATEGLDIPFTYFGDNGELMGYDIEFGKRLAAYLNMDVSFESMSFDALFPSLEAGKADIVVNQLNDTEERRQTVLFSEPYYRSEIVVAVNKNRYEQAEKKFASLADFSGETMALPTGSALDRIVSKAIGNVEFSYTKDNSAAIESVRSGKAAAVVLDKPVAYKAAAANSELVPFPIAVETDDYAYMFPKGSKYVDKFNSALKELRESGKLAELEDYWINNPVENPVVEPQKSTGKNGTVKVTVEDDVEPMSYINGEGEIIGYDIAVCNLICDKLDIKAEYVATSADSRVENIKSGKTDFAVGPFSVTEERKQSVDFCDTTYSGAVTLLVRRDRVASELLDSTADLVSLKEKMAKSRLGVVSGSLIVIETKKSFPNAEILEFNDYGNAVEALKAGKVDYVSMSISSAKNYARHNKDLCTIDENVLDREGGWVACAVRKGYDKLEQINEIIVRFKKDGTMDKIEQNWISETAACDKSVIPVNQDAPVWKIGVSSIFEPMCYIDSEGDIVGFDAELAMRIAYELGMKVEFVNMDFSALIPALQSGKVDMLISDMGITDERLMQVDFSERYYNDGNVVLARKTEENLAYAAAASKEKAEAKDRLSGKKVGVMQGTVAVDYLKENYSGAEILEYDSISDAVQALKSKKVDYVMTVYSTAKNYEKSNDELYVLDDISVPEDIAIAVKKGSTELRDKLDALVGKYKSDGTMDKILANWFGENGKEPAYDTSSIPELDSSAPVLTVGVAANREPMCFVMGEGYGGVDIELIKRIAYELGMRTEFSDMNFSSLIPALENGKVDVVVSNIVYTEERAKIVDFTQPYFDNPQVLLTRKTDEEILAEKSGWEQFWSNFKDSFTRTFITENRWKLVLNGLAVTIIISICAFIVGSIWGGVICALLRSKRKIANIPAKVYVRLLQGTPIVVLLMILYYIVFKDFDINAIVVAIIGFALNLGAYTSQIFKTAIESVDKGQIEAASAMGFNKFQVFIKIIFPQAARNALPVYKGEFISLVKSTSIVGYIAIQDLTKVSDIIRSRTYEAFFPLIATAIIYFLVTYIFIVLLNVLEKKIDPKRRKRVVKGVDEK